MQPELENKPIKNAPSTSSFKHTVWEWVKVIVVALIISWFVRSFIAEPFIIQGASMDPTFSTGQFLIVDRLSYKFTDPQRGDVIIFEYPNDTSLDYIKRIIGLPGETVKIKDGKITIINTAHPEGLRLNETYLSNDHLSSENMEKILSDNQYFVMGDNRTQSSDSRVWGPLDKKYIIGRPFIRLVPLNTISILPGAYHE